MQQAGKFRTPIMRSLLPRFAGDGIGARAGRSAVWSFIDFGGGQSLRLISNLILTRLLFPEAFGLMALVMMVTSGLTLFSDTGAGPLIIQNKRGDDPDFLNTTWTIQVIRGVVLWLLVLAIAVPVGSLYGEPQLVKILPIAGIALIIDGFSPTSIHTVNRHLAIGRLTKLKLITQTMNLVILMGLAWKLQSVWALVIGNVTGSLLTTVSYHVFLPGMRNRFLFEREAAKQILTFSKWIFLSTAAAFVISQGDRVILGLYVSLETLGVYNIGYFIASAPLLLSSALQVAVMTPLYRLKPPSAGDSNRLELFRARRIIALSMILAVIFLGFSGPWIVAILYDVRYAAAGLMITMLSLALVPQISLGTTTAALIGAGDTRSVFLMTAITAAFQTGFLISGVHFFGLAGAILAPGLAFISSYPVRAAFSKKHLVFDPIQDFGITFLGLMLTGAAWIYHWDGIKTLF